MKPILMRKVGKTKNKMIEDFLGKLVIEKLPQIIALGPGEASKNILIELGLSSEQIDQVLEDVNHASGRIPLLKMGMEMDQFSGDFDDSPIFQAAIKIFLEK